MKESDKKNIDQSNLLPDFAKKIYREDRKRYLKNVEKEQDEKINNLKSKRLDLKLPIVFSENLIINTL